MLSEEKHTCGEDLKEARDYELRRHAGHLDFPEAPCANHETLFGTELYTKGRKCDPAQTRRRTRGDPRLQLIGYIGLAAVVQQPH